MPEGEIEEETGPGKTADTSLDDLIEKRRICRMRYTKSEKLVKELQAAAEMHDVSEGITRVAALSIREATTAFLKVSIIYEDLSQIQDAIDYHPDNEARLLTVDNDREEQYSRAFMAVSAQNTYLDGLLSEPLGRRDKESTTSKESFTPEVFAECFAKAVGNMNTGVTETQLERILSTLTKKKRTIDIPKFKGDFELFDQWKELVESEVEKPGYSDVEKAHLVISTLEGDVSKLVASLKDPSYEEIMEFLENRYGDVLARVEKAVNEIANAPTVSSTTVKELDPFYNKLVANWNYILKRTGEESSISECSWILSALVRPKLPKSLVRRWDGERLKEEKSERCKSNFPLPFDRLLEKIQDAVHVARRSEPTPGKSNSKKEQHSDGKKKPTGQPSGSALRVTKKDSSQQKKSESRCVFCNGDHQSYTCPKVKDIPVQERCDRVKASGACFNCLKRGHYVQNCKSSHCQVCRKNHHTLLHIEKRKEKEQSPGKSSEKRDDSVKSSVGLVKYLGEQTDVLMQTAIVQLESKCAVTHARVLFDSGSGVSFISKKMAKELNLSGEKLNAEFTLAGGGVMNLRTEQVKFNLSSALPNWKGETFEIVAYVIDKPSADVGRVDINLSELTHLSRLQLADNYPRSEPNKVDVMLGIEDTTNVFLDGRIQGPRGTPTAQKTHIGWILCGSCPTPSDSRVVSVNSVSFRAENELDFATKHWELEHIGILPNENKGLTELEKSAVQQHAETTKRVGERYETGLLRHPKYSSMKLRSNKFQAFRRLTGLERRLQKDPALAKLYKEQIEELVKADRDEKVVESREPEDRQIWYLPHQPVVKMDRVTTKVRVVFDGSMEGPEKLSINDTLLSGPALQPDLPGVLMRFRRHKVAIVADVEKMFLQVKMREPDRDSQRFLWRDLDTTREPETYRLTTVTFDLSPSPFSSIQTLLEHAKQFDGEYPQAVKEIVENIFVDDLLTGDDAVQDAAKLALDMRNILKEGGWPLRKFLSNKPEALELLEEKDLASQHVKTVSDSKETTKTLGVTYDPKEDVLQFPFCEKMDNNEVETKRSILRQLHRICDPLGMLSPFVVVAKQIFQMAWTLGQDWDDPVTPELAATWEKWKSEVSTLDQVKVKRCFVPEDFHQVKLTLHGFSDASEAAYGAAVYIHVEDVKTSGVHTALISSRTRVAPVGKKRTIPELELMGALVNARLIAYVEKQLKLQIERKICWTDSQVVLHWIQQPAYKWQTFVANRVSEVQELIEPSHWKFIPGRMNPADLCSRGVSAEDLVQSSLWWNGPEYLREGEDQWPKQPALESKKREEADEKSKKKSIGVFAVTKLEQDVLMAQTEYVKKFSSCDKFLRVMTLVRSWLYRFRNRTTGVAHEGSAVPSAVDVRKEELRWVRWSQEQVYREEIEILRRGEKLPKSSKLSQLDPYWDPEGEVLRVGGRLQYSTLPEGMRNPIILPTHDCFVEKLVMGFHTRNLHTGASQTLASLRNRYWLIHGRQEVRRIIYHCRCKDPKKLEQKMAPLPLDRTVVVPAFTNAGVDFAGPLFVRILDEVNRKAYICLFTCMSSRAIHLELVPDLTTEQFLMALRRMIGRRGQCSKICSDNAKTFKKADSILKKIFKTEANMRHQVGRLGITWNFITERAPWHGGFYERMVRCVKTPLKRILGKTQLTYTEMETLLVEIEAQVNSRPLTPVSSDKNDKEPLTPGHLVIGRAPQTLPDIDTETKKIPLGKRWAYQQRLSKMFWNRWIKEYLLELNYRKKWLETQPNLKIGDVVLVAEDNTRRHQWVRARVEDVHPGRDGLVRSVTLKTVKGIIRRPIQRLRLFEAVEV